MTLTSGTRLSPDEILSTLGKGGMGGKRKGAAKKAKKKASKKR